MDTSNEQTGISLSKSDKTAILFGGTGLIGGHCKRLLLEHPAYRTVRCFQRKKEPSDRDQLEVHTIDFDRMADDQSLIKGHDIFICLGTTMRKAGGKKQFYRVDYEYVVEAAKIALENGASQLCLVSSVGADRNSWFFYSRVKGLVEDRIREMSWWATHIFRPSVLLGKRPENRIGEEVAGTIGKGIDWLTGGLLSHYRPVEAEIVARAMIAAAQRFDRGTHTYSSHELEKMVE